MILPNLLCSSHFHVARVMMPTKAHLGDYLARVDLPCQHSLPTFFTVRPGEFEDSHRTVRLKRLQNIEEVKKLCFNPWHIISNDEVCVMKQLCSAIMVQPSKISESVIDSCLDYPSQFPANCVSWEVFIERGGFLCSCTYQIYGAFALHFILQDILRIPLPGSSISL